MLSTLFWLALGLLLACLAGFGLAASLTTSEIVTAVNARLPSSEHFEALGWWLGKTERLRREYRRLYPSGSLLRRLNLIILAGVSCLVLAALLFLFGSTVLSRSPH